MQGVNGLFALDACLPKLPLVVFTRAGGARHCRPATHAAGGCRALAWRGCGEKLTAVSTGGCWQLGWHWAWPSSLAFYQAACLPAAAACRMERRRRLCGALPLRWATMTTTWSCSWSTPKVGGQLWQAWEHPLAGGMMARGLHNSRHVAWRARARWPAVVRLSEQPAIQDRLPMLFHVVLLKGPPINVFSV